MTVTGKTASETDKPKLGRGFALLWSSATVSSVGDGAFTVAVPLLAAFLTGDPLSVAVVAAASTAPWFLVSFWSGAIVDRLPRRAVMIVTDLLRAASLLVLVGVVVFDVASAWVLALIAFLVVTGKCFFDPAAQALLPNVVGRQGNALARANGRLFAGETVGQSLVGPTLGGYTFAVAPWLPFAIDAFSFTASAGLVSGIQRDSAPSAPEQQNLRAAVREGFAYLFHSRLLILFSVCLTVFNVGYNMAEATLVLFAKRDLGVSSLGYGLLIATSAMGAVLAGWIAAPVMAHLRASGTVLGAVIVQAIGWAGIAFSPSPWVAWIGFVLVGGASTLVTVAVVSVRQQLVPDHLLGRVVSAFRLIGNGIGPIGAVIGGLIAAAVDLRAPLFAASGLLVVALAALAVPLLRLPRD